MNILGSIKEKVVRYIDVYIRLFKINLIGHVARLVSYMMHGMIALLILFCIILFLGFGLTELFVSAGMCKAAAFFITIGIYLLLLIIMLALRRRITGFFAGRIISVLTEDEEKDNQEKE